MSFNRKTINKNYPGDLFETPEWIAKLMQKELIPGTILDPCCGNGALTVGLNNVTVTSKDISIDGFDYLTTEHIGFGFKRTNELGHFDKFCIIAKEPISSLIYYRKNNKYAKAGEHKKCRRLPFNEQTYEWYKKNFEVYSKELRYKQEKYIPLKEEL